MKNFEIVVNERVIEAINYILKINPNLNKALLAESIGIKPAKFSEILNKRMAAGMDIIQKLCSDYAISANWLITGEGEMCRQIDDNSVETNDKISRLITILEETLKEKDKQIEKLMSIIEQGK
ncbi:MAG: hypothetical protein IKU01_02325 [Bacteroidales bacterium]|nr:hypothetical protein [Bacteroidales bacterium]